MLDAWALGTGHRGPLGEAGREVRDKIYKRLSTRKREREKRRKRNRRGHFLIYKQNVCRVAQVFMKHFKPADTAAPTLFPAKLTLQLFGAWEQMAAAAAAVSSRSNCGGM